MCLALVGWTSGRRALSQQERGSPEICSWKLHMEEAVRIVVSFSEWSGPVGKLLKIALGICQGWGWQGNSFLVHVCAIMTGLLKCPSSRSRAETGRTCLREV